ncbi:unnamed protein product [Adineta ricciae]|uniref:Fatty acyl-CoA reductase n=1 Tax=Adineta ricciae TaxID=249248 RepID=A0A814WYA0_ADIRI|nr:unnamed protein product [Adineta ricciae]
MTSNNEHGSINEFFNGKSVFITGGTGFVGKQIIEKLLRSCSDIRCIYILIRSKRGANINIRIDQLCSSPLFDKIRSLNPNFQSKLIPINGDLTKVNFDLTHEDEQLIVDNCHVIINSGASVRFTVPLKEAIKSNVLSVQSIINLCKKMKQLQSCVHISTAYVHCYRTDIDEIIYPTNENPSVLLDTLEFFNEKIFDHFSKRVLAKFPNTYTYTKSLAEQLILQEGKDLPIAIVRPSIIGAAWKEPIEGWIDCNSGVTNVLVTTGKRLLRTIMSNSIVDHPMIPVDTVANMTIVISWFTAVNQNLSSNPTVYNCCSGTKTKTCLNLQDFLQTIITEQKAIQYENYQFIEPHLKISTNRVSYYSRRFIGEILPAYLMDFFAFVTFRSGKMIKLDKKINNLIRSMEPFSQNQWIFSNKNSENLLNQMNHFDKQEFNFDTKQLNWSSYLRNYSIGTKKYLLKEPLHQLSRRSTRKTKIRYWFSIILFLLITLIVQRRIKMINQLLQRLLRICFRFFIKTMAFVVNQLETCDTLYIPKPLDISKELSFRDSSLAIEFQSIEEREIDTLNLVKLVQRTHRAYEATAPLRFLLLLFAAGSVQGSGQWWVRGHRTHHRYVVTDLDPYSAHKGVLRLVIIHHSTFCVNSLAHYLGDATFDDKHSPRDHLFTALLTFGEGYHNFHHEFPSNYRNGIKWFHYNTTKLFIRLFGKLHLANHLKQFPTNEIEKGRYEMERKKLNQFKEKLIWPKSNLPIISFKEYQILAKKTNDRILILIAGFIHNLTHFIDAHP